MNAPCSATTLAHPISSRNDHASISIVHSPRYASDSFVAPINGMSKVSDHKCFPWTCTCGPRRIVHHTLFSRSIGRHVQYATQTPFSNVSYNAQPYHQTILKSSFTNLLFLELKSSFDLLIHSFFAMLLKTELYSFSGIFFKAISIMDFSIDLHFR